MLVTLTISQWTARKHDKSISTEVDRNHGAKNGGRYNKLLVRADALDPIEKVASTARAYLYKMTHAWGDNGERMLPAALFLEFGQTMQQMRNEFDSRVQTFVNDYPMLVQEARVRLGTMYNPQDYPPDVRSKFSFPPPAITPVPSADDFRVKLNQDYVDSIKADLVATLESRQKDTLKQCWARVRKVVTKITELGNDDSRVFDSVITNAQELISILPALNLTDDPELNEIADELQTILVPPDRLRQDKRLKQDVASKADAILAKLPWT